MNIKLKAFPLLGLFVCFFVYNKVHSQTCDFGGTLTSCTYSSSADLTVANLDLADGGTIVIDLQDTYTLTISSGFTIPENTSLIVKGNLYFNGSVANNGSLYIFGSLSGFGSIVNNPSGTMKILNDISISGSGSKLGGTVRAGGDIGDSFIWTDPEDESYTFVPGEDDDFITHFPSYLPVELISFDGKKVGDDITLEWVTASEINSAYFEIEQSYDLRKWESVGRKDAKGNSDVLIRYTWIDAENHGGYYRLKQFDLDDSYTYYGPIKIQSENSDSQINIFPNLIHSSEKIYLTINNQKNNTIDCQLIDNQGRVISTQNFKTENQSFTTSSFLIPSSLRKGFYFLKIHCGSETEVFKIFVER